MIGKLEAIFVAIDAGAPMIPLLRAELRAGIGILGDRYADHKGTFSRNPRDHELTLIDAESLEILKRDFGIDLPAIESRRNLLTRGIVLTDLIGKRFLIGESVLCEATRLCEPCGHLEEMSGQTGLRAGMAGRAGIRAIVLSDGRIHRGDNITPFTMLSDK